MKKYLKQISLLAAAVLPCACMVGPDYEKPDNSEFVDFEKFANENGLWKNAAPRDTAARGDWWEVFGDAELSKYMRECAESNPDLKSLFFRFEQAR